MIIRANLRDTDSIEDRRTGAGITTIGYNCSTCNNSIWRNRGVANPKRSCL